MSNTTRFAPSPSGPLHLGHAYAAIIAHHFADQSGGKMVLRIDDLDHTRCRKEFCEQIFVDLKWLNLVWGTKLSRATNSKTLSKIEIPYQSSRLPIYRAALENLRSMKLVYPCYLSKKEITKILTAPHNIAREQDNGKNHAVTDTDKLLRKSELIRRQNGDRLPAWRLRMKSALKMVEKKIELKKFRWFDHLTGWQKANPESFGDVIIARADIGASYHLSVVVDDALDQIDLVTRGNDLFCATHLHRLLQAILGLPTPKYLHHEMVLGNDGKRLAKRSKPSSLAQLRDNGETVESIISKLPPIPRLDI